MLSWNNPPLEILENVFITINEDKKNDKRKSDLFECELVCRLWKLPAKRLAYSNITLTTALSTQELLIAARINQQQSFGKFVRYLSFNLPRATFSFAIYLPHFLALFPYLEHLKIPRTDDQFYQALVIENDKGNRWKYLKCIAEPILCSSVEHYVAIVLAYCQNLTSVLLCDKGNSPSITFPRQITTAPYHKLTQKLDQFPKLSHLGIRRSTRHGFESFDSVIESCQVLKSINMVILPNYNSLTADDQVSTTVSRVFDISLVEPRPFIKRICGSIVIYNDNTLNYIARKFTNLDILHINDPYIHVLPLIHIRDDHNKYVFSPSAVASFLSYISKIPSYYMQFQLPLPTLDEALSQYGEKSPGSLHSLKFSYKSWTLYYFMAEKNGDPNATIRVSKVPNKDDYGDEIEQDEELHIIYSNYVVASLPPHLNLIKKFGQYIDRLSVSISTSEFPGVYTLDSTFEHCLNLRQLVISKYTFVDIGKESCVNDSIKDLVLDEVMMKNKEVLSVLSLKLPSLQNLSIESCDFLEQDLDDPVKSSNCIIEMENTSFDTLSITDTFVSGSFRSNALYLNTCNKRNNEFYKFEYNYITNQYESTICLEDEYNKMLKNKYYVNVGIRCFSIKQIKISVSCFSCELTF